MSLFESYHLMGDPAGFHHYISQPADDDVVHVQMLNHSSSLSRTPSPSLNNNSFLADPDFTFSSVQPDPLVQSFFSFKEESPASYDLLMSFTFPDATLHELESEGEVSHPWLHLTSAWSSFETLYDTTPSEIEHENYLHHLRTTPHPDRLYHVMNYGGSLLGSASRPRLSNGSVDLSRNEKQSKPKSFVTKIRSFVRRLKK